MDGYVGKLGTQLTIGSDEVCPDGSFCSYVVYEERGSGR